MTSNKPIIYWDTNVWISKITGYKRNPHEIAGIEEVVKLVDGNKIDLITSVITRIEILRGKITDNNIEEYVNIFVTNPNIEEIEVTRGIVKIAHEIRSFYKKDGRNISTPDVIHLATAIWANVDAFHTFDGSGKKKGLLGYNEEDGVRNLKIVKPDSEQTTLEFTNYESQEEEQDSKEE